MRVTWVNRTFGDYRIPVYAELDQLLGHTLRVVYSSTRAQPRVQRKAKDLLGPRAIGLPGERILFRAGRPEDGFSNGHLQITYQPGLARELTATEPDVIIAEGFATWTPAALLNRVVRGTPLVVSYQRTHHTERHSQWYRTAYRRAAIRLADVICCNGRLSAEYSRWLGMPGDRIITGANAADTEGLRHRCAGLGEPEKRALRQRVRAAGTVFLYVGRLIKLKGIDYLLRGFAAVAGNGAAAPATLLIVGDGPERGALTALAERAGLTNVRFVGAIDYDEIAPYYTIADVFVIPTLEDNWSLVVPEAMACGLPVLSSRYNGCWPELVQDGVNGFTFDPYQVGDVAGRLKWFLDHPEAIGRMGDASKRIVTCCSPKRAAHCFFTACQRAASRPKEKVSACGSSTQQSLLPSASAPGS